MTKCVSIEKY